jgi:hypothetical protein
MKKNNIIFDGSILNEVSLCGQKYEFSHERNLRPVEGKATPLEEGDLLHHIFEKYYKAIRDRGVEIVYDNDKFKSLIDECVAFGEEYSLEKNLTPDEASTVIFQFQEYAKHYRMDGVSVKVVEEPFITPLHEEEDLAIFYTGKIDLIGEVPNFGPCIMDHKKAARTQVPSSLSNQFTGYSFATGIRLVMINKVGFQKTLAPEDRFKRYPLYYTESQIQRWKENTIWWGRQLAFYIENNTWPENRTSCDKYGGCIFSPICEAGTEEAREWIIKSRFVVGEPWDVTASLSEKSNV